MNTQINQTQNKEKKTNTFKRFFNKHEMAIGTVSMLCFVTSVATAGSYCGVKSEEESLVYKNIEQQTVKDETSETIKFKEPLSKGTYSTSDDVAHKMFGELEQKTEVKIGDETFYLSAVDSNRIKRNKEEVTIILVNKESGKRLLLEDSSYMLVNVEDETKKVLITLDTIDTKEGKKLKGIKIKYF